MSMRRVALLSLVGALLVVTVPSAGSAPAHLRETDSCSKSETQQTARGFIRAYNGGDISRLDRMWAQEPDFQWYFVDDERDSEAEDRLSLPAYFAERGLLEDRLTLRRLRVAPGGSDFSFTLRRSTSDERKGAAGLFHGKGAARDIVALPSIEEPVPSSRCLLVVWSMDRHTQ